MQPHDPGRAFERAEHQADPPVLLQVRDGLDAAAGQVEVRDLAGAEHAKRVEALGRQVDEAIAGSILSPLSNFSQSCVIRTS